LRLPALLVVGRIQSAGVLGHRSGLPGRALPRPVEPALPGASGGSGSSSAGGGGRGITIQVTQTINGDVSEETKKTSPEETIDVILEALDRH
jgi:hypothetical protein